MPSRPAAAGAALALGALLAALVPAPAAAVEEGGLLRLAHLSPDTAEVDVVVAADAGGSFELTDVGYGVVSAYQELEPGGYTISMIPAGTDPASAPPVISAAIDVTAGRALTVAAYGPNDALQASVFEDDLTPPAEGQARVRVLQASTVSDPVTVRTTAGEVLAEQADTGEASGYAALPAGTRTVELSGSGGASASADVDLAAGTVSTLLVLDTADGGLTATAVVDSAATAQRPIGGVDTGGGWLAQAESAPSLAVPRGALLAV
ncbi:DUF4397 domain-containing protein [Desertivibrio insolitus]|uniref:DUF4397 domain-containing protein n=1 Tax=Herbiconiux sp. SYSU D00978 TaxID=2812562 RepID=UPI001A97C610|nr:DUF4397 domain-containing protein [Herbiconiux sp. SYSU D00978]